MILTTKQLELIDRATGKGSSSQSTQPPSGGSNPPLTADEIAFRDKLSPVVFAQLEGAFKRVLDGAKPSEVMPVNKAEDKKIVDAVRDVWFKLFKKGGDEGLKNIRRFPKASKGMNWFTKKMMDEAEEVNIKATTPKLIIPEWVEDPEVLAAIERELFKFAHSINQTTADRLRQVMLDGMENGLPIRSIANTISDITEEWAEGSHAEMIARTETARAYTEGRTEAWRSTGVVERKIWHAAGDACPFCLEMDGRAISLDETFFDEGDSMSASWRGHELNMDFGYSDVKGPPLHPNCRCVLLAELSEKGEKIFRVVKGGPGSGNFDHEGRPGEVGGSRGGGGGGEGGKDAGSRSILKPAKGWDDPNVREHPFPAVSSSTKKAVSDFLRKAKDNQEDISSMGKIQDVPISKLRTGQSFIQADRVRFFQEGGQAGSLEKDVMVFKVDNELYLKNGNHRAVAAWLSGANTISARVILINKE